MARQLTGKQQVFLDVLFDEAGGNMTTAKKLAKNHNIPCQALKNIAIHKLIENLKNKNKMGKATCGVGTTPMCKSKLTKTKKLIIFRVQEFFSSDTDAAAGAAAGAAAASAAATVATTIKMVVKTKAAAEAAAAPAAAASVSK